MSTPSSVLPMFPYLVFAVLEPIALIAGLATAWANPDQFVADQYPSSSSLLPTSSPNAQILAYQLGNTYGVLAILGAALLHSTTDVRLVRGYIAALAVGDVGHLLPTTMVLGWDRVLDVQNYNSMMAGNIVATVFLFVTRIAYLAGLFGGGAGEGTGARGKRA